MYAFTSNLHNYNIDATDGQMGKIKDLYIEEETWKIRYAIVDTRKWLPGRKVLLSPSAFIQFNAEEQLLEVEYDKEMIKNSPPLPEEQDLTSDKENQIMKYFGWSYYYPGDVLLSNDSRVLGVFHKENEQVKQRPEDFEREQLIANHRDNSLSLRSHEEIMHARVHAKDGRIGSIVDFLYDKDWKITHLVVQNNDLETGEFTSYAVNKVTSIDWHDGDFYLNETMENYKVKPKYDNKEDLLQMT